MLISLILSLVFIHVTILSYNFISLSEEPWVFLHRNIKLRSCSCCISLLLSMSIMARIIKKRRMKKSPRSSKKCKAKGITKSLDRDFSRSGHKRCSPAFVKAALALGNKVDAQITRIVRDANYINTTKDILPQTKV
jgi:hypothetical protein